MNLRLLLCLCCLLWAPARAGAAGRGDAPLTLALFAPTAPLGSAEARFTYVERLSEQLERAGVRAQGKAFARAADLEAAVRRGQVDLAILDAAYLAEQTQSYPVLAATTVGGETQLRWGLYTAQPRVGVLGLAQARLAYVTEGGRELEFLENVLLDGELRVAQHFNPRAAPDVVAAVSDVALRQADCVFAPEAAVAGKGLRRAFDAGRLPTPALVQVRAGLPKALVAQVKEVLLRSVSLGVLDGFRATSGDVYRDLRARMRSRAQRRFLLAEPRPLLTAVRGQMITGAEGAAGLLPLSDVLVSP